MAKKKEPEKGNSYVPAPIAEQPITETLETNYMPYAMSVIISRAIPEIDGLKPSHRKLLYTMYKMGLLGGKLTKSANIVGQTMKLNPHGDQAIYATMVRLTEGNETLLLPLIESKGNFGKQYSRDMDYAAARYTEARLAPVCSELFTDINKNTVKFVDSYDGEMQEPTLLPVSFPNILVNPNLGIAVGMASNICSFNLTEVCNATVAYLKDPKTDIMEHMPAPDFPLGGNIIYDEAQMRDIYETGRGSFKMRAEYTYDKKNNCIEVTEIPYSTTVEAIIEKLLELIKANKLKEISDVRDETGLDGFKLTIDLKRGTNPDDLMLKLFKMTPLEDSFGCNFNVLIENTPKVLGVRDIIGEWVEFRMGCIKRGLQYDIDKKTERLHLLTGLKKILLDIDKAVSIIRHTELEADVVPNLMVGFDIDQTQAEYVAEIKLRNLNREYILKRTDDIEKLIDEIDELNRILSSDKAVKKVIAKQLEEISKKYGKERKSRLVKGEEIEVYEESAQIEDYPVTVFVTKDGYLKKVTQQSLKFTTSEHKLKEDDVIVQTVETTNKSEVLFFTDKSTVYKTRLYEIEDGKVAAMGKYMPQFLGFENDEKPVYAVITADYSGHMLFSFENGKMARVPLSQYATKTNRKRLINAYSDKSPIVAINYIAADTEFAAFTDNNKALVFSSDKIPEKTTKSTQGVQVMKITKKGAKIVRVLPLDVAELEDPGHFRTKNIPAAGSFLRKDDVQLSLFDN
ncbi:MAG: topoisomerase IV [Eubacteriales bacterium]|nr:topoisomerase IV [Eubacteriales bacterium]